MRTDERASAVLSLSLRVNLNLSAELASGYSRDRTLSEQDLRVLKLFTETVDNTEVMGMAIKFTAGEGMATLTTEHGFVFDYYGSHVTEDTSHKHSKFVYLVVKRMKRMLCPAPKCALADNLFIY